MPIPLSCTCGRAFNIKDECAGYKIRCPQCKTVLDVPAPQKDEEPEEFDLEVVEDDEPEEIELEVVEEEEVMEVLPAEPQTRRSAIQATPSAKRPPRLNPSEDDARIQTRQRRDEDEDEDEPRPKRRRPKLRREEARGPSITFERGWFGSTNSGVLGGLLMILIAVVWLVAGLAINRIFIYPLILFVVGVIAVIKGLAGG